jgi:integrase
MPAPYDLVVRLLGTLGLRWGEVAALRRGSIDLVRRRVTIEASLAEVNGKLVHGPTKTHASRSIPLPGSLVVALERHLEANVGPAADAYAFTGERGGLLRHSGFYHRLWRPALRTLGLPIVGVHVLRHSAAAGLIAAGAAPKAVQSIMGHASAAFTLTVYGHLFDTDLDALADRLDELRSDRLGGAPRPLRGLPERTAQAV